MRICSERGFGRRWQLQRKMFVTIWWVRAMPLTDSLWSSPPATTSGLFLARTLSDTGPLAVL